MAILHLHHALQVGDQSRRFVDVLQCRDRSASADLARDCLRMPVFAFFRDIAGEEEVQEWQASAGEDCVGSMVLLFAIACMGAQPGTHGGIHFRRFAAVESRLRQMKWEEGRIRLLQVGHDIGDHPVAIPIISALGYSNLPPPLHPQFSWLGRTDIGSLIPAITDARNAHEAVRRDPRNQDGYDLLRDGLRDYADMLELGQKADGIILSNDRLSYVGWPMG